MPPVTLRHVYGVGLRPSKELQRVVYAREGLTLRAVRVVAFAHEWAIVEAKLGRRVGIEAFISAGGGSQATSYRRLREFRAVFGADLGPGCTPADLITWPQGFPAKNEPAESRWHLALT